MTKYSSFNIVYHLQKWMDSVPGQTFLNYAYSWGASIVILGTLFKLTHLPGANLMLFLGMGTEVVVFFLSAFDRPFDKTADGRELPTHITGEEPGEATEEFGDQKEGSHGGTIIIGGGGAAAASGVVMAEGQPPVVGVANITEATEDYLEELKKLTEIMQKVAEQGQRLACDSDEMQNLNRTLTGISTVYELQLKGVSQQIGTIDQINEQTRRMAQQIEQLNQIYARMIEAMTVANGLGTKN